GLILYPVYRRYVVHVPLRETVRAPVLIGPAIALEYRSILVPVKPGRESEEAIDFACRIAAERRSSIAAVSVVVVPLELPLDAELPEAEAEANDALDAAAAIGELYGVDVIGRLLRARSPGRAIVREAERRQTELIVLGAAEAGLTSSLCRDSPPGTVPESGPNRGLPAGISCRRGAKAPTFAARSRRACAVLDRLRRDRLLDLLRARDHCLPRARLYTGCPAAHGRALPARLALLCGRHGRDPRDRWRGDVRPDRLQRLLGLRHRLGALSRLPDRDRALRALRPALCGRRALHHRQEA